MPRFVISNFQQLLAFNALDGTMLSHIRQNFLFIAQRWRHHFYFCRYIQRVMRPSSRAVLLRQAGLNKSAQFAIGHDRIHVIEPLIIAVGHLLIVVQINQRQTLAIIQRIIGKLVEPDNRLRIQQKRFHTNHRDFEFPNGRQTNESGCNCRAQRGCNRDVLSR